MRFGSVCSGIEAASQAWNPLGWKTQFVSEIEPFPCAVLEQRHPAAPNYGDMTKYKEWSDAIIDVFVGGTPCQSYSVAGLRKGLADPRGNLMLTFGAIAGRYRPRWLVWENVPGVLSSNGGRDFGTFLGMLGQLGYGFAYRVLDAQFFGVAQRRRRVFVVGYLGDWRPAAAVLFERDSLCGNPAPSRKARETVAGTFASRTGGGGFPGTDEACSGYLQPVGVDWPAEVAPTLNAHFGEKMGLENQHINGGAGLFVPYEAPILAQTQYGEIAGTLTARHDSSPCHDRGPNIVVYNETGHGFWNEAKTAATLRKGDNSGGGGARESTLAVAFAENSRSELRLEGGDGQRTGALSTGGGKPGQGVPMVFQERGRANGRELEIGGDIAYALTAPNGGGRAQERNILAPDMSVRRLTPIECERLQGFPDNYTQIEWRNKPAENCPDGPRYKTLGNSMAVPVMRWIGERINNVSIRG